MKQGTKPCSTVPLLPFLGQGWNSANCPNPWSADGRVPGMNVVPYAIPPISAYSVSGGYLGVQTDLSKLTVRLEPP